MKKPALAPGAAPVGKTRGDAEGIRERPSRPPVMDELDAPRPARRKAPPIEDVDDYDRDMDYDDRPRKKRKKAGSKGLVIGLIIGGSTLVLLVTVFLITGLVWPGFLLSRESSQLLAFMPANSNVAFGANLAALKKDPDLGPLLDKVMKDIPQNELLNTVDIEEILVAGNTSDEEPVIVVRTKTAFDPKKIQDSLNAQAVPGKSYFRINKGFRPSFLAFPGTDRRVILGGGIAEGEFEKLMVATSPAVRGELLSKVQAMSGKHVWGVIAMEGKIKQEMDKAVPLAALDPDVGPLVPAVQRSKFITFWVGTGQGLKAELALTCANAGDAGQLKTALSNAWNTKGKMVLGLAGMGLAMKGGPGISTVLKDITDTFKIDQSGSDVLASIQFSPAALKELKNLPMDKGFGPGPRIRPGPQGGGGRVIFNNNNNLANTDPSDPKKPGCRHKIFNLAMIPGSTYTIDLKSNIIDCYLRLEDSKGNQLMVNDDAFPGRTLDSQIVFRPTVAGNYRIIATSLRPNMLGPFELTVRQNP